VIVGYIDHDITYMVPGLGSPNAKESSSVYASDISNPPQPSIRGMAKTGPLVGEIEQGIATFSGSHPNAIAAGPDAIYVLNGNNDSVSVLQPRHQDTHQPGQHLQDSQLDLRHPAVEPVRRTGDRSPRSVHEHAGLRAVPHCTGSVGQECVARMDRGDTVDRLQPP
jgi:hypothetical protein